MAFLQRMTGAVGEARPYATRMEDWRAAKDFWEVISEVVLRATVMSTMEPEVIEGGRRMEGNSICRLEREMLVVVY